MSWIELVLRPSGARKPLTASIDHAKYGAANLGRGENMCPVWGQGVFICVRDASCGSPVPAAHLAEISEWAPSAFSQLELLRLVLCGSQQPGTSRPSDVVVEV